MPTRLIRDGIITSERVNRLDWESEVFYRRLMSVADDYGLYDARAIILRSVLYPLKLDTMRESNVERCLKELEAASLVRFYEVDGKPYLQIEGFNQQKKTRPKWPVPAWGCVDDKGNVFAQPVTGNTNPLPSVTNRNESLPSVTKAESKTKPESYSKTKENVEGNSSVGSGNQSEQAPPPVSRNNSGSDMWVTNRVGTLDRNEFVAWLKKAHAVMPDWKVTRMNYAEQEASVKAFQCCKDVADRDWQLLRDYYAAAPDKNSKGEKYWHPVGRKMFFDSLGDILVNALRWAKETRWRPARPKEPKEAEKETPPEDRKRESDIVHKGLQLVKAGIEFDGTSSEDIEEKYKQLTNN